MGSSPPKLRIIGPWKGEFSPVLRIGFFLTGLKMTPGYFEAPGIFFK